MPPRSGSRYTFCSGVLDDTGRLYLTDREPYRFHEHADTRTHMIVQGDALFDLAGRYFAPLPRACGFWWVIADFNSILDPTVELEPGEKILIPSLRVLTDVILGQARKQEAG